MGPSTCCFQHYDWPSLAKRVNQSDVVIIDTDTYRRREKDISCFTFRRYKGKKAKMQGTEIPLVRILAIIEV